MTDRLFKFGSLEEEIMKSMETTLVKYQKDQMYGHEKLAKAVDHLSAAAEIFDDTGFSREAEFVTRLIEKIASGEVVVQDGPKPMVNLNDPDLGGMIDEEIPEYQKSPVNKLIEEELSRDEILKLLNRKDQGPAEPFAKSPSAFPPPALDIREEKEPFAKSPSAIPPMFEDPLSDAEFEGMFRDMSAPKFEQRLASDKKKV